MTAPAYTQLGYESSKTTGTSLTVPSSSTLAVGDFYVCYLCMDTDFGAVTFTPSTGGGDAVLGGSTRRQDVVGLGIRSMLEVWVCTTAGTTPSIVIGHPSIDARAAQAGRVRGAQSEMTSNATFSDASATDALSVVTDVGECDITIVVCVGNEGPGGDAIARNGATLEPSWTELLLDTSTKGTTGAGAASNVSIGQNYYRKSGITSDQFTNFDQPSGLFINSTSRDFHVSAFPFRSAPATVVPLRSRVHTRQAVSRASVI